MKHNSKTVGIRALKQNASAVVAAAAAGEIVTITNRGRPVARLTPIPGSRLQELIDAGLVSPAKNPITELPDPHPGPNLTDALVSSRQRERY